MADGTVYITVNGEKYPFRPGQTLAELVASFCARPGTVVAELNEAIIPPEQMSKVALSPEDRLELVHFVGGG